MNKYKARKNESSDNKRDAEGPNTLHENVSSGRQAERNDQKGAQPRQREPEYKPKHGKKWPAVLLAGIAAVGAYDIGTHHQEVMKFLHVVETSISEGMQQAQQPPYKKVIAAQPAAVHYSQAPAAQHPAVVKEYVTRYVTRYVATPVQAQPQAQPQQMTAQEMQYKLQNRQLNLQARAQSMQYRLQQEQLRAQEHAQAQDLALQRQQQSMQYNIQQRYATIQQVQGTAYAAQNYVSAFNMLTGRY